MTKKKTPIARSTVQELLVQLASVRRDELLDAHASLTRELRRIEAELGVASSILPEGGEGRREPRPADWERVQKAMGLVLQQAHMHAEGGTTDPRARYRLDIPSGERYSEVIWRRLASDHEMRSARAEAIVRATARALIASTDPSCWPSAAAPNGWHASAQACWPWVNIFEDLGHWIEVQSSEMEDGLSQLEISVGYAALFPDEDEEVSQLLREDARRAVRAGIALAIELMPPSALANWIDGDTAQDAFDEDRLPVIRDEDDFHGTLKLYFDIPAPVAVREMEWSRVTDEGTAWFAQALHAADEVLGDRRLPTLSLAELAGERLRPRWEL